MIGQNPKAEVTPFSSVEIGVKNISFWREMSPWTDGVNLVPNSGRRNRTGICRTVVEVIRYIETTAEITRGREAERILNKKNLCLQARAIFIYIYIKFRQPVKEKILSEGTCQKAKYCTYIFCISLNLKKESKKEERHLHLCIICW